ncbi:unnamed protein product [Phytomonas sp. EM1]|nr:unnamed protein product [Phytomonas sp. EM1]|eukprot:CCW62331.1 unnamed protein product [Phytomonas sp. isolate EM1]
MNCFLPLSCRGASASTLFGSTNSTQFARRGLATLTGAPHRLWGVTLVGVSTTPAPAGPRLGPSFQRFRTGVATFTDNRCPHHSPRRSFMDKLFRSPSTKVTLDDLAYDMESPRYRGTVFGLPADSVIFYTKIFASIMTALVVVYVFFKGMIVAFRFDPHTVARMGFVSGFVCCMVIYTTIIQIIRRVQINSNVVYNHSIALVMRNAKVREFLGQHPRTGAFKAYAATGGFKLPLLRRIRSGSYELSDLLGLKPRRLQMVFVLKSPIGGREGVVYCDVRKESTGFMTSEKVYKSLVISLIETSKKERETVILIGRPEDVVDASLLF